MIRRQWLEEAKEGLLLLCADSEGVFWIGTGEWEVLVTSLLNEAHLYNASV